MNFLKALFGGKEETPEERQQHEENRNFDVLKYDGIRAVRVGKAEYAVRCFREALALRDDLEVRDHLANALIRMGAFGEAIAELRVLANAQPDNQAILLLMARVAHMEEDYAEMEELCQKAIDLDDSYPEAYYLYAQALIGQGRDDEAVSMLSKAVEANPQFGDAVLLRGQTWLRMGHTDEASADAQTLMETAPDNEDVQLLQAAVLQAQGRHEDAIDRLSQTIDQNPFCIEAFRMRAAEKEAVGDVAGAEADRKQLAEIAPGPEDGEDAGIEKKVNERYKQTDAFGVFSS